MDVSTGTIAKIIKHHSWIITKSTLFEHAFTLQPLVRFWWNKFYDFKGTLAGKHFKKIFFGSLKVCLYRTRLRLGGVCKGMV